MLQLIENLDTATPQVMIEARIVETTKSLGRSLGIAWGVAGAADVAHGNTTNSSFPNTHRWDVQRPSEHSQTIATVRLGNILDSFNLDVGPVGRREPGPPQDHLLAQGRGADEHVGARSSPGVQIPVQTNVNNTTTVIYVDATLKLTVTPQITNEGTILHDRQRVQKRAGGRVEPVRRPERAPDGPRSTRARSSSATAARA